MSDRPPETSASVAMVLQARCPDSMTKESIMTREALPVNIRPSLAALFLISADPPITEVELEFLRQVQKKVPRLFFVLNKIDYLDDRELEQALGFYKRVLSEQTDLDNESPVFCVSARNGLKARAGDDAEKWAASGMATLETFLVEFLARKKFNALADAVSFRAVDIIDAALMEAGKTRREAHGGSAAAEVDRLGDQIARLKRLKAELAAFGPESTD